MRILIVIMLFVVPILASADIIDCPSCDAKMHLLKTGKILYPEFEEILICSNCRTRRIDGVFHTEEEWSSKKAMLYRERLLKENAARIETLKSYGWTEDRIMRVLEGYIYIGDTPEIVREAWGPPEDINRTITAYGTSEQWVYGFGCYVYFEDSKVTAIQD